MGTFNDHDSDLGSDWELIDRKELSADLAAPWQFIDLSAYDIKDGDEVRVETVGGEWKVFVNGAEAMRRDS